MTNKDIVMNLACLFDKVSIRIQNDKIDAMNKFHKTQSQVLVNFQNTQTQVLADIQSIICMSYFQSILSQDTKTNELIQNLYLVLAKINYAEIQTMINFQKIQGTSLIKIQNAQIDAINLVSCARNKAIAISLINQDHTCNEFNLRYIWDQANTMYKVEDVKIQALENVWNNWVYTETENETNIDNTLNEDLTDQIISTIKNLFQTLSITLDKFSQDKTIENHILVEIKKVVTLSQITKNLTLNKIIYARELALYEIKNAKILAIAEIQYAYDKAIDEEQYNFDQLQPRKRFKKCNV